MRVIGITGSVGMGKSTVARMVRQAGIPVHDADTVVHQLMAPGGKAVTVIAASFSAVVQSNGAVDRALLGQHVFADDRALSRLESILHPLVRADRSAFIARHRRAGRSMVALDVPLLYETHSDACCDDVLVVSAPPFLQRQRVLNRQGMSETIFRQMRERQMSDREKRRRADYVIPSGLGLAVTRRTLKRALRDIRHRKKKRL